MANQSAYHEYVVFDLLRGTEGLSSRAMFGGYGLYKDGVIFGIIANDQLFFKADKFTDFYFTDEGSERFGYEANGRTVLLPYWELPQRIMDDPDELKLWVDRSAAVTLRATKIAVPKEVPVVAISSKPIVPVVGLLFDLYGVVCVARRQEWFEANVPNITAAWPILIWLNRLVDVGQISFTDYLARVATVANMPVAQVRNGLERAGTVNEDVEKLLGLLKARYPLALFTNSAHELTERILRRLSLTAYFTEVMISSRVGLVKPQPEFYLYAAAKMGVVPERLVLIDDNPVNVAGARSAGMQAIVFKNVPDLMHDLLALGVVFT